MSKRCGNALSVGLVAFAASLVAKGKQGRRALGWGRFALALIPSQSTWLKSPPKTSYIFPRG